MRVILLLAIGSAALAQVNFDNLPQGTVPPHWTSVEPGAGQARPFVRRDPTAPSRPNVIGQSASSGSHEASFPLVYDNVICRDGDLSVKFKIAGGRPDQSAGVVFRYQDPHNYYLVSFSVGRQQIRLVRVVDGKYQSIHAVGHEVTGDVPHDLQAGQWYVTKLVFRGPRLRVLFGNRKLFEVEDSQLQ